VHNALHAFSVIPQGKLAKSGLGGELDGKRGRFVQGLGQRKGYQCAAKFLSEEDAANRSPPIIESHGCVV